MAKGPGYNLRRKEEIDRAYQRTHPHNTTASVTQQLRERKATENRRNRVDAENSRKALSADGKKRLVEAAKRRQMRKVQ